MDDKYQPEESELGAKSQTSQLSLAEPVLAYTSADVNAWTPRRRWAFRVMMHSYTDMTVSGLILFNIVVMIYETDQRAADLDIPQWAKLTNIFLLTFYVCELSVRLYVFRSHFFRSGANNLDFAIVGTDLLFELLGSAIGDMPNVTMLRILRVLRALRFVRAVRSLVFFRELYMIMNGFFSAMKAIVWATVLLFVVLMLWSVVAVELIQPLVKNMPNDFQDCERCSRAFSSTMNSMLTFTQQIVAGDEWGASTIPVIEKHPWTAIFFGAVLVSVDLGLMNLILSVIVDKAQQAHQDDLKFQVQEKEEEFKKLKKQLLKICAELDEDQSGCLTLDELLTGFDVSSEFHMALSAMDVQREDISSLFNILDDDGSGHVEYDEFVDQLHKMKTQDTHVVLVFIRGHVKEIKAMMGQQAKELEKVENRLDNHEQQIQEVIRLLVDLKDSPGSAPASSSPMPQVFRSTQMQSSGGCFDACSPAPQQKFIDYRSPSPPPLTAPRSGNDKEVKALREEMAGLDASLKRILQAQKGQPASGRSQPPSGSPASLVTQQLLTVPPDSPDKKTNSGGCCTSSISKFHDELNLMPVPPGDVVVPPYPDGDAVKPGKGFGKGKFIGKV